MCASGTNIYSFNVFCSLQLAISGVPVKAVSPYSDKQLQSQTFDTDFAFLEEEVFAEDGLYEDIIAVDYKDM